MLQGQTVWTWHQLWACASHCPDRVAGSWSGMCNNCVSQFGPSSCVASLTPKFDATRDDLMSTGFIPAQVAWPLQVEVTQIYGQDFNPALICQPPPPGVDASPQSFQLEQETWVQRFSSIQGTTSNEAAVPHPYSAATPWCWPWHTTKRLPKWPWLRPPGPWLRAPWPLPKLWRAKFRRSCWCFCGLAQPVAFVP